MSNRLSKRGHGLMRGHPRAHGREATLTNVPHISFPDHTVVGGSGVSIVQNGRVDPRTTDTRVRLVPAAAHRIRVVSEETSIGPHRAKDAGCQEPSMHCLTPHRWSKMLTSPAQTRPCQASPPASRPCAPRCLYAQRSEGPQAPSVTGGDTPVSFWEQEGWPKGVAAHLEHTAFSDVPVEDIRVGLEPVNVLKRERLWVVAAVRVLTVLEGKPNEGNPPCLSHTGPHSRARFPSTRLTHQGQNGWQGSRVSLEHLGHLIHIVAGIHLVLFGPLLSPWQLTHPDGIGIGKPWHKKYGFPFPGENRAVAVGLEYAKRPVEIRLLPRTAREKSATNPSSDITSLGPHPGDSLPDGTRARDQCHASAQTCLPGGAHTDSPAVEHRQADARRGAPGSRQTSPWEQPWSLDQAGR